METKEKPLNPKEMVELQGRLKNATGVCKPVKTGNEQPTTKKLETAMEELKCTTRAVMKEVLSYLIERDNSIDSKQKNSLKKDVERYLDLTERLSLSIVDDSKKLNKTEIAEMMGLASRLNKYLEQANELKLIPK